MAWGRNGVPAQVAARSTRAARPVRHGAVSVILALVAPLIVVAAFAFLVNLPKTAPQSTTDLGTFLALSAYGLVAPVMHILGIGFGIAGLRNPAASKPASVVGILLNIALLVIGILLGWAALEGMSAFT